MVLLLLKLMHAQFLMEAYDRCVQYVVETVRSLDTDALFHRTESINVYK